MTESAAFSLDYLFDGPVEGPPVALAHGAGAPMDSPFLARFAAGLAARGCRVARFEFPYMAARRRGERRPPDREPVLRARWAQVAEELSGAAGLVLAGKSLGGRIASMVADEVGARGVVALGYPFHPPGQPERLRTAHLAELVTPMLIVQGTRDPFGGPEEVAGYRLSPRIELAWLEDGDHSFVPRVRSGHTEAGHLAAAVEQAARFIARLA
jgi:predicted alpha/beta-hydrolase family hydrolase